MDECVGPACMGECVACGACGVVYGVLHFVMKGDERDRKQEMQVINVRIGVRKERTRMKGEENGGK